MPVFGNYFPVSFYGTFFGAGRCWPLSTSQNQVFNVFFWPKLTSRWRCGTAAFELGDVHEQQVWRFLRAQRIDLDGRKSWCESDDPDFAAKAADVVGLYIAQNQSDICGRSW